MGYNTFSRPNYGFNYKNVGAAMGMAYAGAGRTLGGTSSRFRINRRTSANHNQYGPDLTILGTGRRRALNPNSFHAKLIKQETAQHSYVADSFTNISMVNFTHNTIWTFSPSQVIQQGTLEGSRVGNQVYMNSLKVNCYYSGPTADSNGVEVRLITFFCDRQVAATTGFVSGFGRTGIFGGGTGATYTSAGITDPKIITVLDDRTYAINPQFSGVQDTVVMEYTVALNKSFTYEDTSVYGKDTNLYIIAVPSIVGGTTGTTACGSLFMNSDLIFRNSR